MAATTPTEANKALVQRVYEELLNEQNYDVIEELYASDFVSHRAKGVEMDRSSTLEELEADARMLHEAFPDFAATIEAMVAEDDMVAARISYTGTHEGEYLGVPATGKSVSFAGTNVFRIEDGQIEEVWPMVDTLGVLQQLGVSELPDA